MPFHPRHRRDWRTLWRRCICGLPAPCIDRIPPSPPPPYPPRDSPLPEGPELGRRGLYRSRHARLDAAPRPPPRPVPPTIPAPPSSPVPPRPLPPGHRTPTPTSAAPAVSPPPRSTARASIPGPVRTAIPAATDAPTYQPLTSGGVQLSTTQRPEHLSDRPDWLCRACGHPWPCPEARACLLSEYRAFPSLLRIYLSAQMYDALEDLTAHGTPPPLNMYERFLSWARPTPPT
ncbi:hypothetical protein MB27_36755 [Actinoplanes utahensis]|uniref:Flavin reductase n=1 Tax=Actinoplanes utahensis TaxID=1869 RepID=A0A0A6UCG7_ACTUT|nr:hypothetical protein MB27_36755 [Actinoplanes utahensis]